MAEIKDGVVECTSDEYHADRKYKSSSVLKVILKSLADYKAQYIDGNPKEFSNRTALDEGSLAHSYILEPHLTNSEFNFFNGFRKVGPEFDAFMAGLTPEEAKRPVISMPQKVRTLNLVAAYKTNAVAVELLSGGEAEQSIFGTLLDMPIKVRFDYINVDKGYIADVKTTGYGGDIDSFKQTIEGFSYQLSAALYCMMAEQYYGKPFEFYFVVLSKKDLSANVYITSEATMETGKRMVKEACTKYKNALKSGIWEDAAPVKVQLSDEVLEV